MTRKTFERGEAVEVQRRTGAPWIRGAYRELLDGKHIVDFPTYFDIVPSSRIRKRVK